MDMNLIAKLREPRIGPFAIFDFAAAYAGAWVAAPYLKVSRKRMMYLVLPLGAVTHAVLGTKTPLNDMLTDPEGHWGAKAVVAGSLLAAMMVQ
jgi:hypothetical protein